MKISKDFRKNAKMNKLFTLQFNDDNLGSVVCSVDKCTWSIDFANKLPALIAFKFILVQSVDLDTLNMVKLGYGGLVLG